MEDLIMLPVVLNRTFPRIFDDFFGGDWSVDYYNDRVNNTTPSVNVVEKNDQFNIDIAAPGLKKKDINIDLENNVLTISSEKEHKNEVNEDRYLKREFYYNSFKRSFSLPQTVNTDKISASHDNGVLHIVIPKKAEAVEKPARSITIA